MGCDRKDKDNGQKTKCKAIIDVEGFQEEIKPQSKSPIDARYSFKLMIVLSANQGFKICSIDSYTAFLQTKPLDWDLFIISLVDITKQGKVWKLLKLLYGLDNASKKFWLKVRENFFRMGLKTFEVNEGPYYLNERRKF